MAIYHLCAKVLGRSRGRSATCAAAYRSGERIHDSRTGVTFDYTRRRYVAWKAIAAPEHSPSWVWERSSLWNTAEKSEKRSDAQVAREIELALPIELSHETRLRLITEFVEAEFVARGMVADISLHDNPNNPHCHILMTLRELLPTGFGTKVREWNDRALLLAWRESWARHCNQALEREGNRQRVDHRSLFEQGINQIATRHQGARPRAKIGRALVRRRQIEKHNREKSMEKDDKKQKPLEAAEPTMQKTIAATVAPIDTREATQSRTSVTDSQYHDMIVSKFGDRIHGVQYYDDYKSLHIRLKGGSLRDFGDRITAKFGGMVAEIAAIVELALLKGWTGLVVKGSEHFRRSLWLEAVRRGYPPTSINGYEPKDESGKGSEVVKAVAIPIHPSQLEDTGNRPRGRKFGA